MSKSEGFNAEIGRRTLMKAATVLAVVPATATIAKAADGDTPPTTPPPDTTTPPTTTPPAAPPATTPATPAMVRQLFWTTETTTGRVMGIANGPTVKQWKGIPYGASTGGTNRFMPPRKPQPWYGTRECFTYGPISPQPLDSLDSEYGRLINWDLHPSGMGENCLTLNVWTTSIDRSAKKAVLVSFHGGGFASGSGNQLGFDGAKMAETRDVVVVTVNHRLNAFGYLNLIDLGAPDEFQFAGVCGIMDLQAALEWVRDNIENFGGDPSRVMIFGQSGGGAKTSVMLGNPSAKGLFHRAAVQSGSALRLADPAVAAMSAEKLLDALGISTNNIAAIQRRTWQEILQAMVSLSANLAPGTTAPSFSPVLDGTYLPHHPFDPTAPEESADVPVIISSTLHDAALSLTNWDLDDAGLRAVIAMRFGEANADAIIAAQKAARPQDSNYLIQASAFTDGSRARATYVQAERKAALGKAPVYVYQWDWISNMADGKFGAVHGIDVSASFNNARDTMMSTGAAAGKAIADKFSAAWAAFAKTGDPNTPEIPQWAPFDATTRTIMVFDNETRSVNDYRGDLIRQAAAALPPPTTPGAPATPPTTPTTPPTTPSM